LVTLSEKDLVKRCKRGDQRAFAELVDHYKAMVFTIINRMIFNKSIIEDLAQQVFIRVYKGVPNFRGESKLSTWIYRITYNVCLAEISLKRNQYEFVSLDENNIESNIAINCKNPEEIMSGIELSATIKKVVNKLPPQYKMAITLYYFEQMPYKEIGEVMGLPMGTVKTYLHRAKKYLRNMLVKEALEREEINEVSRLS